MLSYLYLAVEFYSICVLNLKWTVTFNMLEAKGYAVILCWESRVYSYFSGSFVDEKELRGYTSVLACSK